MNMSETPKKKKARLRYDNVFKTAWTVVRESSAVRRLLWTCCSCGSDGFYGLAVAVVRPTATASPQKPSDGRGISDYMD